MNRIHAYASNRRLVDHIAPIWNALDDDERGTLYAGSRESFLRARDHGIDARLARHLPNATATREGKGGRQPHWLVASFSDLGRLGGARRAILLEHGSGQTYSDGGHPENYSGGPRRHRVDLFLCPNQTVADRNGAVYPNATAVAVGCPRLDALTKYDKPCGDSTPIVAFTFHWDVKAEHVAPEARWAWPHYRTEIERLTERPDRNFHILGHGHPFAWGRLGPWWYDLGVETAEHFDDVAARADVLVADNTSALYEFAALDRPVVVLNAPWYRRDVEHGLRFWESADVGLQVDDPADLWSVIQATLGADPQAARRREIVAEVYPHLGESTGRAVEAMRASLPG